MIAAHRVFLYGTLCDPELFGIVAGHPLDGMPAELDAHRVVWADGEAFPLILPAAGGVARGIVVEVSSEVRARLDYYELGFGYRLEPVETRSATGAVRAEVYFPDEGLWQPGAAWSLSDWQRQFGELSRAAAEEYMRLFPHMDGNAAARAFGQIRSRAASRLRALARPSPAALMPAFTARDVVTDATTQPYTDFFAIREDVLRFPTFGGGLSGAVKRASFLGGDAVTVLPYDPAADAVLVVRQFRHGAFVRGDPNPWCVEPPAGRIDVGETAEEAAHRELLEETGLTARALHQVASFYPTPGAVSEHLTSYIAICDLAGRDGLVGGVAGEAEDIMSHVVPLDRILEMVEEGVANTGPLIMSLFWLAARRGRL